MRGLCLILTLATNTYAFVFSSQEAVCFTSSGPKFFNFKEFGCWNGTLVRKPTPPPDPPVPHPDTLTTLTSVTIPCRNRGSGHKCCGEEAYQPSFQTCCKLSFRHKTVIYDSKPEQKHACCKLEVYPRDASMPCKNSARNDGFFKAKPLPKNLKSLCGKTEFVFKLEAMTRSSLGYDVNISRLYGPGLKQSKPMMKMNYFKTRKMTLPLDERSPKKDLTKEVIIIFSNDDLMHYLKLDIYMSPGDELYKIKRRKKMVFRKVRKLKRVCKRKKNIKDPQKNNYII